jgi:hypothetical protein
VPNYVDEIHTEKVTTALERELTMGRVIRTSWEHVSGTAAIGIVDKQRSGFVKHRLILDLSRPDGLSTNARATVNKRVFPSVRDAMDVVRPGDFMARIDVSEFYRNFPMAFHHWRDLGFQWTVFGEEEPAIMCETRMPFGLCTAPGMADRLTSAIVRHMKSKGFTVVGYLDDFLIIANTQEECQEAYVYLLWFLRDLGLPVNEEKCVGPTQTLVFLGVELSTVASTENEARLVCTAGIDSDRVAHVIERIKYIIQSNGPIPAKALESVLGLLVFVSQVIWGSRLYLRSAFRILREAQRNRQGRKLVTVSKLVISDLKWRLRLIAAQTTTKLILGLALGVLPRWHFR